MPGCVECSADGALNATKYKVRGVQTFSAGGQDLGVLGGFVLFMLGILGFHPGRDCGMHIVFLGEGGKGIW